MIKGRQEMESKTVTKTAIPNPRLRSKIVEKFWTQAAFAKVIETKSSVISRVIRGWVSISEKKKQEWAKALDCRVEDIF